MTPVTGVRPAFTTSPGSDPESQYRVRIIGVLDLTGGLAVQARAGQRAHYAPVRCVGATAIPPGDAVALAAAYRDQLGIDELYAADLDAILAGMPQRDLLSTLAGIAPLWLDAGITTVDAAREAIAVGAHHVVIGLETLASFAALEQICRTVGDRAVFSVDLRDGRPIHRISTISANATPLDIARRGAAAGVQTMMVLDLSRVGIGQGLDFELLSRLREAMPDVTMIAGGGVRGFDDLSLLANTGCDGAMVATALQDGRLNAGDIAAARRLQPSVSR